MKTLIYVIIALAVAVLMIVSGCGVVIHDKIIILTLGKDIAVNEIYLEKDMLWITDYDSDAADARIEFDPLTKKMGVGISE